MCRIERLLIFIVIKVLGTPRLDPHSCAMNNNFCVLCLSIANKLCFGEPNACS